MSDLFDIVREARKIAAVAELDTINGAALGITREEYQRRRQENVAWMRAKAARLKGAQQ